MRGDLPVARALDIGDRIGEGWTNIRKTKTIAAGRYSAGASQQYYTFDLAYTPNNAESQDVLYYLVSSVTVRERLYAMVIECTADEYATSKAALDQLRGSFRVQRLLPA